MLLPTLAFYVGAIWLMTIGEWGRLASGFFWAFIIPYFFKACLLPTVPLALISSKWFEEKDCNARTDWHVDFPSDISSLFCCDVLGTLYGSDGAEDRSFRRG
jgi:hypothetical protein